MRSWDQNQNSYKEENTQDDWSKLPFKERAALIGLGVQNNIYDINTIRDTYNKYASGGNISIKPENRGKFTELKERTGKSSTWYKEHGTPEQKKMAVFALNARKWNHKHEGTSSDSQLHISVPVQHNDNTYVARQEPLVVVSDDNGDVTGLQPYSQPILYTFETPFEKTMYSGLLQANPGHEEQMLQEVKRTSQRIQNQANQSYQQGSVQQLKHAIANQTNLNYIQQLQKEQNDREETQIRLPYILEDGLNAISPTWYYNKLADDEHKITSELGQLAGDVFMDPTTYMSMGIVPAIKTGGNKIIKMGLKNYAKSVARHTKNKLHYTLHPFEFNQKVNQHNFDLKGILKQEHDNAKKALNDQNVIINAFIDKKLPTFEKKLSQNEYREYINNYSKQLKNLNEKIVRGIPLTKKERTFIAKARSAEDLFFSTRTPDFEKMSIDDIKALLFKNINYVTPDIAKNFLSNYEIEKDVVGNVRIKLKHPITDGFNASNFVTPQYVIHDFSDLNKVISGEIVFPDLPGFSLQSTIPIKDLNSQIENIPIIRTDIFAGSIDQLNVPEEYTKLLQKNIEYLEKTFDNKFKPFGSAQGVVGAGFPHATHDIDGYMTEEAFEAWRKKNSNIPINQISSDTYKINLFNDKIGDEGLIDVNVIRSNKRGSITGERALEMYRQIDPEGYSIAAEKAQLHNRNIEDYINVTPKELYEMYNPTQKTIIDSFEINPHVGNKEKHSGRPFVYLSYADENEVANALKQFSKNIGATEGFPAELKELSDVKANLEILKEIGFPGNLNVIAASPQKMKNALDYWYLNQTVHMRGAGIGATNAKNLRNQYREWVMKGGNVYGAGLNTELFGNSNFGPLQAHFQVQPITPINRASSLKERVKEINRFTGSSDYIFNQQEQQQLVNIAKKCNLPADIQQKLLVAKNANDILNIIPDTGRESKAFLQAMRDEMGIVSLTRNKVYRQGLYSSITGILPENQLFVFQPQGGHQMQLSGIVDRKSFPSMQNSSVDKMDLESQLNYVLNFQITNMEDKRRNRILYQLDPFRLKENHGLHPTNADELRIAYAKMYRKQYEKDHPEIDELKAKLNSSLDQYNKNLHNNHLMQMDIINNLHKANKTAKIAGGVGLSIPASIGSYKIIKKAIELGKENTKRHEEQKKIRQQSIQKAQGGYLQNLTTKPFSYYPIPTVRYDNGGHLYGLGSWLKKLLGLDGIDDNDIAVRQAYAESGFDSNAVSSTGAAGIFQIRQNALDDYNKANNTNYKTSDLKNDTLSTQVRNWIVNSYMNRPWNTKENMPDSIKYARTLAAHNFGATNMINGLNKAKADGKDIYGQGDTIDWSFMDYWPKETRDYVNFILRGQDNSLHRNEAAFQVKKKLKSKTVKTIKNTK